MKTIIHKLSTSEKGQILPSVMILLLFGSLVIAPLLLLTNTMGQSGEVYKSKMRQLYAADAGVEHAIWQIKYDQWVPELVGYDSYYYSHDYDYSLSEPINDCQVGVTLENLWVPVNDVPTPTASEAHAVIDSADSNIYLVVTGRVIEKTNNETEYQIKISYKYGSSDPTGQNLRIKTVGIWLPPGFSYPPDPSPSPDERTNLALDPDTDDYADPAIIPHGSGADLLWNFTASGVPFYRFPDYVSGSPAEISIKLKILGPANQNFEGAAWVTTTNGMTYGLPANYSWDADFKLYRITSVATDNATSSQVAIEAYSAKDELRELPSAVAGDYYATGNSLMSDANGDGTYRERLYEKSSAAVSTNDDPVSGIPADANLALAYLYWTGWIDWHGYGPSAGNIIFSDDCSSFSNWTRSGSSRWQAGSGSYSGWFRGQGQALTNPPERRTLTLTNPLPLGDYAGKTVILSFNQAKSGTLETADYLYVDFSSDNFSSTWTRCQAFHGQGTGYPRATFSCAIPDEYLTDSFKMRFYFEFDATTEYVYIDNITITEVIFFDGCSNITDNWTAGSRWSVNTSYNSGEFQGQSQSGASPSTRQLTLTNSLDLSDYSGETVAISWDQYKSGTLASSDALKFALSKDGTTFDSYTVAFQGNSTPATPFPPYTIPEDYLTENFKIRFYIDPFSVNESKYAYIDNIMIYEGAASLNYPDNPTPENLARLVEETARVNQVMFSTTTANTVTVTADNWETIRSTDDADHHYQDCWSYTCFADITNLLTNDEGTGWIDMGDVETNGATKVGKPYTLGHVVAPNEEDPDFSKPLYPPTAGTTGYPLGTPAPSSPEYRHNYCHAGWSIVLIYSGAETKGHQLYLYDIENPNFTFVEAWAPGGVPNPDFDGDGVDGGSISGFLIPDNIEEEGEAGRLTLFVGEGDSSIANEYVMVNGYTLVDIAGDPVNNAWNSHSSGLSVSGIDIDTFVIEPPVVDAGDTEAHIDLPTGGQSPPYSGSSDGFAVSYIIISFRSEVTAGGTITFLIRQ